MEKFFGIGKIRELSDAHKGNDGPIASIFLRVDEEMHVYERRVYSFFDFTGEIGGTMELLTIFGAVIVKFISEKKFHAALIKNIYHVKKQYED